MNDPFFPNLKKPPMILSRSLFLGIILLALAVGAGAGRLWFLSNTQSEASSFFVRQTTTTSTGNVLGLGQSPDQTLELVQDADFAQFWKLWKLVKEKYYQQPVTDQQLFYGAMAGLAQSVKDPYTTFFEPVVAQEFQQALSGTFEGIGAEIGIREEQIQIIAPLAGTPAERAGLLAGDWIVKIDKTETAGMTVEKAVSLIRGEKGTEVVLTIFRPNAKKPPYEVRIARDEIRVKSVTLTMLPDNIAHIKMMSFNGDTASLLDEIIRETKKKNPRGVILDLRNNPGGFLETSLQVAGEWIGDRVVTKERRQGKVVDILKGVGPARLRGIPTVVLVNQGSASASEIVAGALQDYKVATVIGMKTFGKGSVQEYETLDGGSAVKITVAEWITPDERAINTIGLVPDVEIDRTAEDHEADRDPQLDSAVRFLKGESVESLARGRASTTTRP